MDFFMYRKPGKKLYEQEQQKNSGRTLFAKDSLVDGVHMTEIISIFTARFWKHCKLLINATAIGSKEATFFLYYEWQYWKK